MLLQPVVVCNKNDCFKNLFPVVRFECLLPNFNFMHIHKRLRCIFFLFYFPFSVAGQNFGGHPPGIKWMQVNTIGSRVIFPAGMDSQARRVSGVVQRLDTAAPFSLGDVRRKWNILLLNQTTVPNAYVRLAPIISELYMTPGQNNFTTGSIPWTDNLIIHEQRHMQQFSNFNNGFTKVFSFLLGQEGQLLANGIAIPDYFFEGDAVWQETMVSRQGRGRMPAFFNGIKSLWLSNKNYNWMKLRSGSLKDYTPDHYELGYPLVAYGYAKYGDDFWKKVTIDAARFKGLFYAFNKAVEKYAGIPYTRFRQDALNYFKQQTLADTAIQPSAGTFITPEKKGNVVDYLFPQYVNDDTVIVTKQSYSELNSFYFLINGREKKIRVKDYVLDDYFSYRNGKVVYAAYVADPRWSNRNYSVIQLLDVYSRQQTQLSFHSKYFSPDISPDGSEIIAVSVNTDGSNFLHRLAATDGKLIAVLPNAANYFYTQTKYISSHAAVSAVRSTNGRMALVKINLDNGNVQPLTAFTYNVLGYPHVQGDTIYYTMMDNSGGLASDKIFALDLKSKNIFRITANTNGLYYPAVNAQQQLLVSAFTTAGLRLQQFTKNELLWQQHKLVNDKDDRQQDGISIPLVASAINTVDKFPNNDLPVIRYKKSFQLLNFHSARPYSDDPEWGYSFFSDNILSNFSNAITYTYNRNEQSHAIGFDAVYGGAFPFFRIGAERSFNRTVVAGSRQVFKYNAIKLNAGFNVPLSFIGGRTFKFLNFGTSINTESIPDRLVNKQVKTAALNYMNSFVRFTHTARKARQNFNPSFAQTITVTYRNAFNRIEKNKLVSDASFFFPGLYKNHSLVLDAAFQKRDTVLLDFFSKTFSTARGYQDYNGTDTYKLGVNYQLPLSYPDAGVGNIIFLQRVRANLFYDYSAGLESGRTTQIKNRSAGTEIYFDTKIWNELPVSVGIRFSRLLDKDVLNPGAVNRWEIILPVNIIPN